MLTVTMRLHGIRTIEPFFVVKQVVMLFKDFVVVSADKQNERDFQCLVNGNRTKVVEMSLLSYLSMM